MQGAPHQSTFHGRGWGDGTSPPSPLGAGTVSCTGLVSASHPPPRGPGQLPGPRPHAEAHVLPEARKSGVCRESEAAGGPAGSQVSALCAGAQWGALGVAPSPPLSSTAPLWPSVCRSPSPMRTLVSAFRAHSMGRPSLLCPETQRLWEARKLPAALVGNSRHLGNPS